LHLQAKGGPMNAHEQRREDDFDARFAAATDKLDEAERVLGCFTNRLGITETAVRIGKSYATAWRIRVWLGVQSSQRESRMSADQRIKLAAVAVAKIKLARALLAIVRETEIEPMLVHLGLVTARGNNQHRAKAKPRGRRDTRAALMEARP